MIADVLNRSWVADVISIKHNYVTRTKRYFIRRDTYLLTRYCNSILFTYSMTQTLQIEIWNKSKMVVHMLSKIVTWTSRWPSFFHSSQPSICVMLTSWANNLHEQTIFLLQSDYNMHDFMFNCHPKRHNIYKCIYLYKQA